LNHRTLSAAGWSLCLAALSTSAFAQGTDTCTSPTAISGPGTFNFNNAAATTGSQGQGYSQCFDFGSTAITRDVWFNWTATVTGPMQVSTCGGTFIDSKLAVYGAGGCPTAAPLDCADDSCNSQSSVLFSATAGNVYAIQLGTYSNGAGAAGTFTVGDPPPPCSPAIGPDVIVGDIQEIENGPPTAALDSISLGTTSCNVGNVNLKWIAGNNQHPVIGGNLYRYSVVDGAGRFEQIGMSWLKHGFYALSEELCCTNCDDTDGTELGVNCSDPYTASRNGTQGNLGPRYQVNAHTGNFVFPPASPGWSGTTARRLEFALADVTTGSGQRYFGECQYVTPDDAAAGNQNNNASHRELLVSGTASNRSFNLNGPTERTKPAIQAWPLVDPGAALVNVQVPGDGLFVVGFHTTPIAGGLHRYEYAVYNMNGDRCGGSFSIPIPAGVNVTNIGFHDVSYRNGDGNGSVAYSGNDWASSLAGGALTWTAETQAQNSNGNALRWGTTYNFRFDADAAPTSGNATIGLWKPGTPTAVTAAVDVPTGGATSFAYCLGDGSGTQCPCGNNSSPLASAGCLHSLGTGGKIVALGSPSISADTLSISGANMPNSSALYFQGTNQVNAGLGAVFGDGLRCVGGSVTRLATLTNTGGGSAYPGAGDPPVSVKGVNAPGNIRMYQCWFRNAASYCNAETFNVTNGWRLVWMP
jgi:hypothetical protein